MVYNFVCAFLLIVGVPMVVSGAVKRQNCPLMCPMNYAPVCGSDGRTYSNQCALDVSACLSRTTITVVSFGSCDGTGIILPALKRQLQACPVACPQIVMPVCGSDGHTYTNECFLHVEACRSGTTITTAHHGACA